MKQNSIFAALLFIFYALSSFGFSDNDLCPTEQENNKQDQYLIVPNEHKVELQTRTFTVNGVSFNMIAVEGGDFHLGADILDGRDSDLKPMHRVTISSFSIGETEVTQALWKAVMGDNPSENLGKNRPVEQVSWEDCQQFISKLNAATGQNFRLPTEAEWEYAARGGNKSKYTEYSGSSNINDVAWYFDNSDFETHPVAQKRPNELGIYDMTGNVGEWCQDWYDKDYYSKQPSKNPCNNIKGSHRVYRGGGYGFEAQYSQVWFRCKLEPDHDDDGLGLRLAL